VFANTHSVTAHVRVGCVCMKVAYSRQRGPLRGAAVAKNVWLRLRVPALFCGVLRTSCYEEAKVLV